jgi:hypothetical protein
VPSPSCNRISGTVATPPVEEGIPKNYGNLAPGVYYCQGGGSGTGECDAKHACVQGRCWTQLCFVGDAGGPDPVENCHYREYGEC